MSAPEVLPVATPVVDSGNGLGEPQDDQTAPSTDGRRQSSMSGPALHSGRKRQHFRLQTPSDGQSEDGRPMSRTPSGLVTEVRLSRKGSNAESERGKSRKSKRKISNKPTEFVLTEVDIDNSDLETVLGEDLEFQQEVFNDMDAMSRHIYQKKCEELGVAPISMVLRKISETELNLKNHQCGPVGARAIAVPLVYNKSITSLDLSSNGIEDIGIRPICDCLMENVAVKDLRLANNKLTCRGLKHIGRLVLNNKNITSLDIAGNHLGDASAELLELIIKETRNIRSLDLSDNNLGIASGICLGQALANNESVEELNLSWNHIRLDGAICLTEGLKENVALHRLDLSWNGFGQETAECLTKFLGENEGLRELNLEGNRLTDEAMVKISKGLQRNEKLEKLVLSKNLLTNVGVFALLVAIKQNENSVLQELDIKDVAIQDDCLALMSEIQEERSLQLLHNIYSQRPHILNPMDVLLNYIMEKGGLEEENMFDLIAVDTTDRPQHTESKHFIEKLKKMGVPLTHSQIMQLTSGLVDEDNGLVDVGYILDAANDLQAETASAATSGSFEGMSSVMDTGSVAPSTEVQEEPSTQEEEASTAPATKQKKEREPIQAGQQYSW